MLRNIIRLFQSRLLSLFLMAKETGFFDLLIANILIGFSAFGSQLLVAKFLSPTELGQIKTLESFGGVAIVLASLGFNTVILKMCSEQRSDEEKKYIFKKNLQYVLLPIILVVTIMTVLARIGILSPDPDVNRWMILYLWSLPSMVYTSMIIVYFQALKKVKLMARIQSFIRIGGLIVLILATYQFGIQGYILSTIFFGLVALLSLYYLIRNTFSTDVKVNNLFTKSLNYGGWSMAANLVFIISSSVDIFMLNYTLKDRQELGYYSLAATLVLGLSYITTTIGTVVLPYFSENEKNKDKFMGMLIKYQKLTIGISLVVTIFVSIVFPYLIRVIYGPSYSTAGIYFTILVWKYFFWSCSALLSLALLGLGKMKYNFISIFLALILSLMLSYILINRYETIGVAIAQVLAYFISAIFVYFITKLVLRSHFKY